MKVFRVQSILTGTGPYDMSFALCAKHSNEEHPSPEEEGMDIQTAEFCGFDSMAKLNSWFDTEDKSEMHSAGCHIVQFSVPARFKRAGKKQVLFEREEAHIVRTYSLKEI